MKPEPRPQAEFDSYAGNYDELLADPLRDRFAGSPDYFHSMKLQVLLAYLSNAGKPAGQLRWLDLGCGRGDLLRLGKPIFADACGCDLSREWLPYWDGLTVRLQHSAASIPYEPGTFDVVTAACVFHHVPLPERAQLMESVCAVLKPGGVFCMFEHNPRNPVTRRIVQRCPLDANAALLYPDESAALVRQAAYRTVSVLYYLFVPEALGRRMPSLERWLKRVPYGGQYAVFGE